MIFRAEVKWSDVAVVGGTFTPVPADSVQAALYFQAEDNITTYNLALFCQWHAYETAPFTFAQEHQTVVRPRYNGGSTWDGTGLHLDESGSDVSIDEADGANGFIYKAGGTLYIEKDTDAETVTWHSPMGQFTRTFDFLEAIGPRPDNSPLLAEGMGHQFLRSGADGDSEKARWFDFYSYQSAGPGEEEIIHGAAMSTADPGVWTFWLGDTGFGGSGTICEDENTQLTNGYQTKYRFNTADVPPNRKIGNREERFWNQGLTPTGVDMVSAPEFVRIFKAGARPYQPQRLTAWTTYDGGRIWSPTVLYEEAGKVFTSPSLTWWNGRLMCVWKDGSNILYQATSFTAGLEWEMPITLPYTGTFPRHIMHPRMGLYLYFFFDGTTLKVARSSDYGNSFWDASPIPVVTGIVAQQIDAEFAFDDSCIVTYFNGGAWEQVRSWDAGLTWT